MATETVTKTELKAVETRYTVCPLCEMEYEPREMTAVYAEPKVAVNGPRELVWLHKQSEEVHDAITIQAEAEAELCPTCLTNIGMNPTPIRHLRPHDITVADRGVGPLTPWVVLAVGLIATILGLVALVASGVVLFT